MAEITATNVAAAWHSVTDRWFTRRNKTRDNLQWELVHDRGGDTISDETMSVIGRFNNERVALTCAKELENEARGEAALRLLTKKEQEHG